jgi:hypothetical protein
MHRARRASALAASTILLALLGLALLGTATAGADSASLYQGPGPRPGPDLLYAPPATDTAAQLTNTGVWRAPPILVSGTSAYRDGEFLYQDFLYDDHGAHAPVPDPNDPRTSGNTFSPPAGTYTYPTDNKAYVGNLADLVEFRVKPLSDSTAIRVTLNSMTDPSLVGFSVAIGDSPVAFPFPHNALVNAPAQYFLTVHGTTAELVTALNVPVTPAPTVTVDTARRQFEVRIPHAAWDPGSGKWRFAAGVGLWNKAGSDPGGDYLAPSGSNPAASATAPGGGAGLATPAAFFNVAFRFQNDPAGGAEPMPHITDPSDNSGHPEWWRDQAQGAALAANNISPFFATIDFSKLLAGTNDSMSGQPKGVPATGPMDRIMASHTETEQGTDYVTACGVASACLGELRGRLQPYAIYIPAKKPASGRYGLTLLLHSLGANYNQFEGSRNQSEFGDRGSIVITPSGRGPDGWYYDYAGADTFEVWADVAKQYPLDQAWTDLAGYSMGGYGTYKFATQFPDLFAKAQPTVGPPALGIWVPPGTPTGGSSTLTDLQLGSLRNIPIRIWDASSDELVPLPGPVQQASDIDALGYRYEFDVFSPAEHLTLAVNDEFQPAADFLGTDRVDLNPPHVTYVYNPSMDFAPDGTAAGHAYWVSDVNLRDRTANGGRGAIDARSEAFGVGDPTPSSTASGGGALTGGTIPAISFVSQAKTWGATPATPRVDRIDLRATNVSSVSIDAARAGVDCNVIVNVLASDGPLATNLGDCPRGAGAGAVAVGGIKSKGGVIVLPNPRRCLSGRNFLIHLRRPHGARVKSVTVSIGRRRLESLRGSDLRTARVDLHGLPKGAFRVKVTVVYVLHGRRHTASLSVLYHTCVPRAASHGKAGKHGKAKAKKH